MLPYIRNRDCRGCRAILNCPKCDDANLPLVGGDVGPAADFGAPNSQFTAGSLFLIVQRLHVHGCCVLRLGPVLWAQAAPSFALPLGIDEELLQALYELEAACKEPPALCMRSLSSWSSGSLASLARWSAAAARSRAFAMCSPVGVLQNLIRLGFLYRFTRIALPAQSLSGGRLRGFSFARSGASAFTPGPHHCANAQIPRSDTIRFSPRLTRAW